MRDIYLPPQKGERVPLAFDQPDDQAPDQLPAYAPARGCLIALGAAFVLWAFIGALVALLAWW